MSEERPSASEEQLQPLNRKERLLLEVFGQEPRVEELTPGQIVRRALFPRWEIITPAAFDPRAEENRLLEDILETNDMAPPETDKRPLH